MFHPEILSKIATSLGVSEDELVGLRQAPLQALEVFYETLMVMNPSETSSISDSFFSLDDSNEEKTIIEEWIPFEVSNESIPLYENESLDSLDVEELRSRMALKKVPSNSILPISSPISSPISAPLKNSELPVFVTIPRGSFLMGVSEEDEMFYESELPQTQVEISCSFEMMTTPVTQAMWFHVMKSNPSIVSNSNFPVDCLNWYEAIAFCNALSEQHGYPHAYEVLHPRGVVCGESYSANVRWIDLRSKGYRLPTEAEWEYACRAGLPFSLYGELDEIAWYLQNSHFSAHEVGQKQPNSFGLYDMLGNVWEWCYDSWKDRHPGQDCVDPVHLYGLDKVRKGGSWLRAFMDIRASVREGLKPSARYVSSGFRVVRTLV